jgi:hypothetical protein
VVRRHRAEPSSRKAGHEKGRKKCQDFAVTEPMGRAAEVRALADLALFLLISPSVPIGTSLVNEAQKSRLTPIPK